MLTVNCHQSADVIKAKTSQKDEIEAGLCSSTYEAVPASASKFRSCTQFQYCLSVCLFPPSVSELSMLSYRMTHWARLAPLLLLFSLFIHSAVSQEAEDPAAAPPPPPPPGQASDGTQADDETEWGLNSIRGGFESIGGYFDSVLEFMGGRDGVCQYRCRYGKPDE